MAIIGGGGSLEGEWSTGFELWLSRNRMAVLLLIIELSMGTQEGFGRAGLLVIDCQKSGRCRVLQLQPRGSSAVRFAREPKNFVFNW